MLGLSALLVMIANAAYAESIQVAAPTHPVATRDLEPVGNAHASPGEARKLEDIVNNQEPQAKPPESAAAPPPAPVHVKSEEDLAVTIGSPAEQGMNAVIDFAHKWRDVVTLFSMIVIALYCARLYHASRRQYRILERTMRAAEDASFAARKSAQLVENLIKSLRGPSL